MPDLTYTLNVDTTRLAGAMSEVRSQLNAGMGGIGGMGGAMGGVMAGLNDFGGAASMAGGMVMRGMSSIPTMQVPSYMDMAMATQPHYGVLNAQASIASEWLNRLVGPSALTQFAPPGVPALEYGKFLARENAIRMADIPIEAGMAALGAVGTYGAGSIGASIGGLIGGLPGAIIGGLGAGKAADYFFDESARERKLVRELGNIADARRGLPETTRRELGAGLADVARGLGVPEQAVADVFAALPSMGMLPKTTDVEPFKAYVRKLFEDISSIAGELHVGMPRAMMMMKSMEQVGFHGFGGALNLIGTAAAAGMGVSPSQVYGIAMSGASLGVQAQIGGRFGFDLAEQSLIAATHSGLSHEQMRMAGGISGLTRTFETAALQNAFGGVGMVQMLGAPPGGAPLAHGLMDQISAGVGEVDINRALAIQVGGGEVMRQLGPRRITEMFRSSIRGMAEMVSPDDDVQQRLVARSILMGQGLNQTQAMAMATNIFDPNPNTGAGAAGRAVRSAVTRMNQEQGLHVGVHEAWWERIPVGGTILGGVRGAARESARWLEGLSAKEAQQSMRDYEIKYSILFHEPSEGAMRESEEAGLSGFKMPSRGAIAVGGAAITTLLGGSGSAADVAARAGKYDMLLGNVTGTNEASYEGLRGLPDATKDALKNHADMIPKYFKAQHEGNRKKAGQILKVLSGGVYDVNKGFTSPEEGAAVLNVLVNEAQRRGIKKEEALADIGAGRETTDELISLQAADIERKKDKVVADSRARLGRIDTLAEQVALAKVMPKTHKKDGSVVAELGGEANSGIAWDRLLKTITKIDGNATKLEANLRAGKYR